MPVVETSEAVRRTNGVLLSSMPPGTRVSLVGRALDNSAGRLTIETSDKKLVAVLTAPDAASTSSVYVEVFGKLNADGTVTEEYRANIGDTFDAEAYNELVALAGGTFRKLF